MTPKQRLGLGIGWRPEIALDIDRRRDLGFVELLAEDFADRPTPPEIDRLLDRGMRIVPHGVSLSLGSAEAPENWRVDRLADLARRYKSPLVSEHLAFVRGGGLESGHLMPVPRTQAMVDILVSNIQLVKERLPVPLAVENIATLVQWPTDELDEAEFMTEVLERADVGLLLDIENVYANARNFGYDPVAFLRAIPLERIAYVHVAGGIDKDDVYHDTHAHAIGPGVLRLLEELCRLTDPPGVLLERDDHFPTSSELGMELDAIVNAIERGSAARAGDLAQENACVANC